MEKDFRDAVNKTMDRVLKMDIYRGPVEILEQRVQENQRKNALNKELENKELEQNPDSKEKVAVTERNSRIAKKTKDLDER